MTAVLTALTAAEPRLVPPFGGSPIAFTVVLVLTALVSGRLLGVHVGLLRRLVAAFIGFIAGFLALYVEYRQTGATAVSGVVFGIPALLVTMTSIVVMELLARPGSLPGVTGTRIPRPIHATRARLRRIRRYTSIVWITTRSGLSSTRDGRRSTTGSASALGRRLRIALERAGGAFVKFGQVLSTRRDLLPQGITEELSALQDDVAPADPLLVRRLVEKELGGPVTERFARFDDTPIAAASLAEAHGAALVDGTEVIVKVQRPHVRASVETDLDILDRLVRRLDAREEWARRVDLVHLADGFSAALLEELDFTIERANLTAMREGAAKRYGIRVPKPFPELSTERVLVMEWLDGVSIRAAAAGLDARRVDRMALVRTLLRCLLEQIFIDGLFHADPHPGNVLVLDDGGVGLIDAGSVGRLNALEQSALRRILVAVDQRDPAALRDALVDIAPVHDAMAEELMERALAQFIARRLGPGMTPSAGMFNELFRLLVQFRLALPPHVAAVFRALLTLEGTIRTIVPAFDIIGEARTFAEEQLGGVRRIDTITDAVQSEVMTQLPVLRRLPRRVDQVLDTAQHEGLALRVSLFEHTRDRSIILMLVDRVVLAGVGAAVGAIGAALLAIPGSPLLTQGLTLLQAIGYGALVASSMLLLRVVIAVARDRAL